MLRAWRDPGRPSAPGMSAASRVRTGRRPGAMRSRSRRYCRLTTRGRGPRASPPAASRSTATRNVDRRCSSPRALRPRPVRPRDGPAGPGHPEILVRDRRAGRRDGAARHLVPRSTPECRPGDRRALHRCTVHERAAVGRARPPPQRGRGLPVRLVIARLGPVSPQDADFLPAARRFRGDTSRPTTRGRGPRASPPAASRYTATRNVDRRCSSTPTCSSPRASQPRRITDRLRECRPSRRCGALCVSRRSCANILDRDPTANLGSRSGSTPWPISGDWFHDSRYWRTGRGTEVLEGLCLPVSQAGPRRQYRGDYAADGDRRLVLQRADFRRYSDRLELARWRLDPLVRAILVRDRRAGRRDGAAVRLVPRHPRIRPGDRRALHRGTRTRGGGRARRPPQRGRGLPGPDHRTGPVSPQHLPRRGAGLRGRRPGAGDRPPRARPLLRQPASSLGGGPSCTCPSSTANCWPTRTAESRSNGGSATNAPSPPRSPTARRSAASVGSRTATSSSAGPARRRRKSISAPPRSGARPRRRWKSSNGARPPAPGSAARAAILIMASACGCGAPDRLRTPAAHPPRGSRWRKRRPSRRRARPRAGAGPPPPDLPPGREEESRRRIRHWMNLADERDAPSPACLGPNRWKRCLVRTREGHNENCWRRGVPVAAPAAGGIGWRRLSGAGERGR